MEPNNDTMGNDKRAILKEIEDIREQIDMMRSKLRTLLSKVATDGDMREVSSDDIADAVWSVTGKNLMDMRDRVREKPHVEARMMFSAIAKMEGMKLIDIGRSLDRDHSTIINLLKRHDEDMEMYFPYKMMFNNVLQAYTKIRNERN